MIIYRCDNEGCTREAYWGWTEGWTADTDPPEIPHGKTRHFCPTHTAKRHEAFQRFNQHTP